MRNCRLFEAERCPMPRTRGICPKAATDAPQGDPGSQGIFQFGANFTSHLQPPHLVGGDRPIIGKSLHTAPVCVCVCVCVCLCVFSSHVREECSLSWDGLVTWVCSIQSQILQILAFVVTGKPTQDPDDKSHQ